MYILYIPYYTHILYIPYYNIYVYTIYTILYVYTIYTILYNLENDIFCEGYLRQYTQTSINYGHFKILIVACPITILVSYWIGGMQIKFSQYLMFKYIGWINIYILFQLTNVFPNRRFWKYTWQIKQNYSKTGTHGVSLS